MSEKYNINSFGECGEEVSPLVIYKAMIAMLNEQAKTDELLEQISEDLIDAV